MTAALTKLKRFTGLSRGARKPPVTSQRGDEPDYRFSLANERTFLAWIRTSLALMAGGIAVVQFVPRLSLPGSRHALGIALALIGSLIAAMSYRRWAANEQAMREHRPLPRSHVAGCLAGALTIIGVILVCFVAAA